MCGSFLGEQTGVVAENVFSATALSARFAANKALLAQKSELIWIFF